MKGDSPITDVPINIQLTGKDNLKSDIWKRKRELGADEHDFLIIAAQAHKKYALQNIGREPMLVDAGIARASDLQPLRNECDELTAIFVTILKRSKEQ